MKLTIQVDMPMPTRAASKKPPCLRDRVDYAIAQIECKTPAKQQAITFLRRVKDKLDAKGKLSEEEMAIKELIKPAIADYGSYHIGSTQE